MAGFLDKSVRIIDMVLTNQGKQLLSKGQLNFCYWTAFDDEIDYDPFIQNSASLTEEELVAEIYKNIESTPIREATTGYRVFNLRGLDNTNVHNPIFTKPQGQTVLPRAIFPTESGSIQTSQRKIRKVFLPAWDGPNQIPALDPIDLSVERFDARSFSFELQYQNDSFPPDFQPNGFSVKIFKSGSSGFSYVQPQYDLRNNVAVGNELTVSVETGSLGT